MEIAGSVPVLGSGVGCVRDGIAGDCGETARHEVARGLRAHLGLDPSDARRSINDTLRHIAYVESYIIDKLIMDREPKTILPGSVFPREDTRPSTIVYG